MATLDAAGRKKFHATELEVDVARYSSMPADAMTPPLILVGGGLANGLIAYRLRQLRPDQPVLLLEQGEALGGTHTWSFHETDVPSPAREWLAPFIVRRWPAQQVIFPDRRRSFSTPYCSITSERFHEVLSQTLGDSVRLRTAVRAIRSDGVDLADGRSLAAAAVIDGRGRPPGTRLELGWQKFLGLEVMTREPHGLDAPIIMDATVPQVDGYRFLYVLPFGPKRLLIEDTHYSDSPGFDGGAYREEIVAYAAERGWRIAEVLGMEQGSLPIALDGDIDGLCADMRAIARSGLAAGLFHPTTGYSLPDAAALADRLAVAPVLDAETLPRLVGDHVRTLWRRRRLYRMLNRLLFKAAYQEERRGVLSHFYRLPQALVERFYADRLTPFDKVRILTGRPPIPISRALKTLLRPSAAGTLPLETRP